MMFFMYMYLFFAEGGPHEMEEKSPDPLLGHPLGNPSICMVIKWHCITVVLKFCRTG